MVVGRNAGGKPVHLAEPVHPRRIVRLLENLLWQPSEGRYWVDGREQQGAVDAPTDGGQWLQTCNGNHLVGITPIS